MIERKCLSCGTWNKDEDYCSSCNAALSPKALDLIREEKLAVEEANRPPTSLEKYKSKANNSKNWLYKLTFYFIYVILLFIGGLGVFMAWLTAMVNA